ncbi:alpha/beta hydrolase [Agriterribacter sp.]|uniref:alpha/beta hydrolase n=1 Tax=Agriterribacter sp. TaxID=2821509 RepID=UPI002C3E0053|nr:alpha/beta hydrolase [Agriterribacter sp.]HRP56226.1 alpha/beta hydrolase [Agriterribacter sp.]
MKRHLLIILVLFALTRMGYTQNKPVEMPLYPENKVPGNLPGPDEEKSESNGGILRISKIKTPTLTAYLPPADKANGTAVIICPGGGYSIVAIDHEGFKVAEKFNEMGVAAFVLKYRIPDKKNQTDPSITPLQDAQQAILTVRANAEKWNIDPSRIGIMGFSAGGHLASTAGTHFEHSLINNPAQISVRPDFMILIYPVISADIAITHSGSFKNLLGANPSAEQLNLYSNEKQVTAKTPPSFLVHASDDGGVSANNSIVFYQALLKNKIPAELHIYQNGGHGFGMHNATTKDEWMERCKNWLVKNGWLKNQ